MYWPRLCVRAGDSCLQGARARQFACTPVSSIVCCVSVCCCFVARAIFLTQYRRDNCASRRDTLTQRESRLSAFFFRFSPGKVDSCAHAFYPATVLQYISCMRACAQSTFIPRAISGKCEIALHFLARCLCETARVRSYYVPSLSGRARAVYRFLSPIGVAHHISPSTSHPTHTHTHA